MKSVKKMVLVSFDKYERMKARESTHNVQARENNHDSKVDNTEQSSQSDASIPEIPEDKKETINTLSHEAIIVGMPKVYQSRAKGLLEHIKQTNCVKWNDRGEVYIDGIFIPNTHITDLIKDCVKEFTSYSPIGRKEFIRKLHESNVPQSLLGKNHRSVSMASQHQQGGGLQVPPGIPDANKSIKQKQSKRKSDIKWIKV